MSAHDDLAGSLADHLRLRGSGSRQETPIVVSEIALGGTYGSAGRVDVATVQILPSYRGLVIHAYEVKASRADLLADVRAEKWRRYLDCCHRLSFAAPAGVIRRDDLPGGVGLVTLGDNGWHVGRAARSHGDPTPDAVTGALMRIIRRWSYTADQAAHTAAALARSDRLRDLAAVSDDRDLAARIGGRVWDIIESEQRRTARLDRREQQLAAREERLAEAERTAVTAPQVLDVLGELLWMGRDALDGRSDTSSRDVLLERASQLSAEADRRRRARWETAS